MAFIPNSNLVREGNRVRIVRPAETLSGTFTVGHEFRVQEVTTLRDIIVYNLIDDDGNQLNDMLRIDLEKIHQAG